MADHLDLSDQVRDFALNWFRAEDRSDASMVSGLSIGSTLSYLIWQSCASILRYDMAFGGNQRGRSNVEIDPASTRLERRVAAHFGRPTEVRANGLRPPVLDEQLLESWMFHIPTMAQLVRRVQPMIHSSIRKRTNLWLGDWVTHHISRADPKGLVLYRRSLLRSAIPRATDTDHREAEGMYPTNIAHLFNERVVTDFLVSRGYRWPDSIPRILAGYVQDAYQETRHLLVLATASSLNMINFYTPERICLPADALETWNIWYQLARARSIETVMYIDGYPVVPYFPVLRTEADDDWLANRFAAYGSGHHSMYRKFGLPASRIDTVYPPFLSYPAPSSAIETRYDAIVMSWTPLNLNPLSDTTSPADSLRRALRALHRSGLRRVAVKARWSGEVGYLRAIADEFDPGITVLQGPLRNHLATAPLFVGGLSTALAEVVGRGRRYVVFEPYENGYTDAMVERSTVVSRNSIARDEEGLVSMICAGHTSWLGDPHSNLLA